MEEFQEFLQQLRSRAEITDVIGGYVNLTRRGSSNWCCCPFHHEKTPSFKIYEENQCYHCYGCGAHGDVFAFIMSIENLDFMGAVKFLAEKYGMRMPDFRAAGGDKNRGQRDRLYQLMRDLAKHYHANLRSADGANARSYLDKRGFSMNTVVKFGLGYALGDDAVTFLTQKGYSYDEIIAAGVGEQKNGKLKDTLAGRLIVPIIDAFSHVAAFGGRELENSGYAKYKNTRETPLFKKSRELFGMNLLKKLKQKSGLESIIVVEGYMDVIALNQAGVENVVASMGTALTEEQARLLARYCDRIFICYDGDAAGQKATLRGLKILKDAGLNVKVMSLIEGLDPDEIIKKYGAEGFLKLQKGALPLTEYRIRKLAEGVDKGDADSKVKFSLQALECLKEAQTVVEKETYLPLVSKLSGLSVGALQRQLYDGEAIVEKTAVKKTEKADRKENAYYKAARFILYSMFSGAPYAEIGEDIAPYFRDGHHTALYDAFRGAACRGEKPMPILEEAAQNEPEAARTLESAKEGGAFGDKYFAESLAYLKKTFNKKVKTELSNVADGESDLIKKQEIKLKIEEYFN